MDDRGAIEPEAAHFRAFVSYSHADASVAQKLHRKIETYKLPEHLRDGLGKEDGDSGRLGRIFRDREDLPAAEDLSQSVKTALTQSQALIILCSPDAKASRWVAKEIELFRQLHPDRPILAALVRGEPEEAFPKPLLQGAEPLAADLRKEGDGWRLGFLKIIAGIAEVPLDALVQRDAQRRLRRVMAVTLASVVGLVAMIGMTIFAIQQRNEAQHQQAEAEGLVEYMLTDLRTELKGVGRLDVMTDVNERAMDFYEGQGDLSDLPAESLERRARILHAMGEDDEKRGDLDKALAKFTEAHRVTEALLARDPDNPDRIFGHAQSEYWIGRVYELRKNWEEAYQRYSAYLAFAQRLQMLQPNSSRSRMELGFANSNLGIVQFQGLNDSSAAQLNFESAVDNFGLAVRKQPDNLDILAELGNGYAWLADIFFHQGKFIEARVARQQASKMAHLIYDQQPKSMKSRFNLLIEKRALALIDLELGNKEEAKRVIEDVQKEMQNIVSNDSSNAEWISFYKKLESDHKKF